MAPLASGRSLKLARLTDDAEADVLAYMTFPAAPRPKPHSTNRLERRSGESGQGTELVDVRMPWAGFANEGAITPR